MKLIVPKVVNLGILGKGKHTGVIQIQALDNVEITHVSASCGCTVPNVRTPFTLVKDEIKNIEFSANAGKVPWRKKLTIITKENETYGVELQID